MALGGSESFAVVNRLAMRAALPPGARRETIRDIPIHPVLGRAARPTMSGRPSTSPRRGPRPTV